MKKKIKKKKEEENLKADITRFCYGRWEHWHGSKDLSKLI